MQEVASAQVDEDSVRSARRGNGANRHERRPFELIGTEEYNCRRI